MYKKWQNVDSLILVKALAITLVVSNHCSIAPLLHGGLNGLMLISGITMSSFSFGGTTKQTLIAFKRFTLRLVIPSFILGLMWGIYASDINWSELLMYSNWITRLRVTLFPIWYTQVMLQLMIILGIIFWAFDLTPKIQKYPIAITSALLICSIFIALISLKFWDTSYLHDKLPHLLAWNFILGWHFWAITTYSNNNLRAKLTLTIVLLSCEIAIFLFSKSTYGPARFIWLTVLGSLVIWSRSILLPSIVAQLVRLIGQSTFYIFLLHHFSIRFAEKITRISGFDQVMEISFVRLLIGIGAPVFIWAIITSFRRAVRKTLDNDGLLHTT